MAPLLKSFLQPRTFDLNAPSTAFKAEWVSPSNYAFTVLLLVGGDVVSRALAQLAGGHITPVAFSFGMFFFGICDFHDKIFRLFGALMFFVTNPHLIKVDTLFKCHHTTSPVVLY